MTPFELTEPKSLREAIELLDPDDTAVRPMSGGTALMLMMKAGVLRPRRLVNLKKIGLAEIGKGPAGELRIGAMARLSDIERSPIVRKDCPVIARTLLTLSNVRVRNVATLGGHLAHADPHMDLPPVLSALGARATIAGPAGERTIPVEEISSGYLATTLRLNELITAIEVPPLGGRRAAYMKCTTRSADDWPALGVAVVLDFQKDVLQTASLVISAATDKPTRLRSAEKLLRGKTLDESSLKQAGEAAAAEVQMESDMHGSAAYKKQLLRVYLGRAIHEASSGRH
ncbi:MAG TPA: xanthine dehydrogenase family protein subunit M [Burkholderiales bacterium]|nr:xanthine dehydrogenase family protein subunit M [Burkholderiales bacterium]